MNKVIRILTYVLEDNLQLLGSLKDIFELEKIDDCSFFSDVEEFYGALNGDVQVCILDYFIDKNREITAVTIMEKVLAVNGDCLFILISVKDSVELNIFNLFKKYRGIRFVHKMSENFSDDLISHVKRAIEIQREEMEFRESILEKIEKYDRQN